jgi:hypothetical protein
MRFVPLLTWFVALAAPPALAEAPPSLRFLEERLASMARENPGEYGIAALDLASGETVSWCCQTRCTGQNRIGSVDLRRSIGRDLFLIYLVLSACSVSADRGLRVVRPSSEPDSG